MKLQNHFFVASKEQDYIEKTNEFLIFQIIENPSSIFSNFIYEEKCNNCKNSKSNLLNFNCNKIHNHYFCTKCCGNMIKKKIYSCPSCHVKFNPENFIFGIRDAKISLNTNDTNIIL